MLLWSAKIISSTTIYNFFYQVLNERIPQTAGVAYICGAMTFEEYLLLKKIDADAYKMSAASQYAHFETEFLQMHPKSFTDQKLFLINDLRRTHPLMSTPTADASSTASSRPKPKMTLPKKQ